MNGNFTKDRQERQRELQRHCEEVCTDQEETRDAEEKTELNTSKKKGSQQFTVDGRKAEVTVDLILQARARMSDNKVNGPENAFKWNCSKFMEDCETGVLAETRCGTEESDQKFTERLRSHRKCRSGTCPAQFCIWNETENLRIGRNYTWEGSMG